MATTTFLILLITVAGCVHARPHITEIQRSVKTPDRESLRLRVLFNCFWMKFLNGNFSNHPGLLKFFVTFARVLNECFDAVKYNPKQFICTSRNF